MPVTFEERFKSRHTIEGPNPSVELLYVAYGSDDDVEIKTEAIAQLPAAHDSKPLQTIDMEQESNGVWFLTLTYAYSSGAFRLPTGGSAFSFDSTGGTRRITQSLQTISSHAPPGQTPPSFNGAINVSDDGVEGVDVPDPVWSFQEIRIVDIADVDAAFLAAIYGLTATTNNDVFQGYARGEVLFLGATGQQRGEDDVEIVYHFRASPNVSDLAVGQITGIAKKGWEYLWVRYTETEDSGAGSIVRRPSSAYVERVFNEGDFSLLGL